MCFGATDCRHTARARTITNIRVITAAVTSVLLPSPPIPSPPHSSLPSPSPPLPSPLSLLPPFPLPSKVFFPMLSRLLEGVELMDAPSLEETRMRASQLLSKVCTCTVHTHLMSIYIRTYAHQVGLAQPAHPNLSSPTTPFYLPLLPFTPLHLHPHTHPHPHTHLPPLPSPPSPSPPPSGLPPTPVSSAEAR